VLDKAHKQHSPEKGEIGSTYWPELGLYSSNDRTIVRRHLQQMIAAKIGVCVVSWYPEDHADQKAAKFKGFQNKNVKLILEEADKLGGVFVAFHLEPYPGRTPQTVRQDLKTLEANYGHFDSAYRHSGVRGEQLLVYVYDSYLSSNWQAGLHDNAGPYCIALLVEKKHLQEALIGGFDGVYTVTHLLT
jgi:glycoprotein endo-alpha-1,2-mannosidase